MIINKNLALIIGCRARDGKRRINRFDQPLVMAQLCRRLL